MQKQIKVKIIKVLPAQGEILKVGQKVNIVLEVKYTLNTNESGNITLVIQDIEDRKITESSYVVKKGTHTANLEAQITVPDARGIRIFTPLMPHGNTHTSVVDSISYKIVN